MNWAIKISTFFWPLLLLWVAGCAEYRFRPEPGFYHEWQQGDSLAALAKEHGLTVIDLQRKNVIIDPEDLEPGMMILIPIEKDAVLAGGVRFPDEKSNFRMAGEGLIWPSPGKLTSKFGRRWGKKHEGIDMGSNAGLDIRAAAGGIVAFAGRQRGYGNTLIIDHGRGIKTLYGHNSRLLVRKDQRIRQGQKVSIMGKSGRSTGVHLHFEVRIRGDARDPLRYLPSRH